jgi:cytochrome c oxidase subunit II
MLVAFTNASLRENKEDTVTKLLPILAIASVFVGGVPATPVSAHPSIDIVASNWKFTPSTIELHAGETTTLRLTSREGVHGLQSDELAIPMTTIEPGSFKSIQVTPKKAGKYVLHCSLMCGAGHADMTLTVTVVP